MGCPRQNVSENTLSPKGYTLCGFLGDRQPSSSLKCIYACVGQFLQAMSAEESKKGRVPNASLDFYSARRGIVRKLLPCTQAPSSVLKFLTFTPLVSNYEPSCRFVRIRVDVLSALHLTRMHKHKRKWDYNQKFTCDPEK